MGIENLEAGYHSLIHSALECYRTGVMMRPNQREAEEYCKAMQKQIFGTNPLTKA